MPEPRRRMRIGPNARRGGNIDDRRNTPEAQHMRYWNKTYHPENGGVRRSFRNSPMVGDFVGEELETRTFRRSIPMLPRRQGLRPGQTATMGRR